MKLFYSWRNCWGSLLPGIMVFGVCSPLWGQEEDDSVYELETFAVVGSRIERTEMDITNPVLIETRLELEERGYSNLGDYMRNLPIAGGVSINMEGSNSGFAPGVTSFNMRGLGNNNTLVLINGRRAAPYGESSFNGFQTVFNFNSLPPAAIERLEILKDGGSAIYGSDAVTGVVNIVLRKEFEGLRTEVMAGDNTGASAMQKSGFLIWGRTWDAPVTSRTLESHSLVVSLDYMQRDALGFGEYSETRSADFRGVGNGGIDRRSDVAYPGVVFARDPASNPFFPVSRQYTFAEPTASPAFGEAVINDNDQYGRYDFNPDVPMLPEVETAGFYQTYTQKWKNGWEWYEEFSFRQQQVDVVSAATPIVAEREQGSAAGGGLLFPGHNPYNIWGQDITRFSWRAVEAGKRNNDVVSETARLVVAAAKEWGDWKWQTGILLTQNQTVTDSRNYLTDSGVQGGLSGIEHEGQILYLNPFGPADDGIWDLLRTDFSNSATYGLGSLDFSGAGPLGVEWAGGEIQMAVGGEYRREELDDRKSDLNETGELVSGRQVSSISGERDVWAAYVEFSIPFGNEWEFQVAARAEEYSDFGSTLKPKFAFRYRPVSWFAFRGSYSESFLAPNLPYLYASAVTSFSDTSLADPKRPQDPRRQIPTVGKGNPDLQPEETDTVYLGIVLEPGGILSGLAIGVEWFQFYQTNLITRFQSDGILALEDTFPELVERGVPDAGSSVGQIIRLNADWLNVDEQKYQGWDLNLRYLWDTESFGNFTITASGTWLQKLELNGSEFAGKYNNPRWRANTGVSWKRDVWGASIFANYTGRYLHQESFLVAGKVEEDVRVNVSVHYDRFFGCTLTVGVNNLFDSRPPFDPSTFWGYNNGVSSGEGAFVYMRLAKDW